MTDDESYIIRPKDPSAIVRLQDPSVIEQILDSPLPVLAEIVTGYIETGNGFWAGCGARLAQAALKGRMYQQFGREFKQLRDKGKIPDDFAEKKYGYKSWVELLTVLDEDTPDEDRLDALNAMFYSVNKVGVTDGERIANYQLFQIAKRLTSTQLMLLKVAHDRAAEPGFQPSNMGANGWLDATAKLLGHGVAGLVEQDERALMQNGLLTGRIHTDQSGVNDRNGRLTPLALKFYGNLKTYRSDLASAENE